MATWDAWRPGGDFREPGTSGIEVMSSQEHRAERGGQTMDSYQPYQRLPERKQGPKGWSVRICK